MTIFEQYRAQYQKELFSSVVPFWMKNALDPVNGGIYTCLDRRGAVYSTDKSGWFQGRAAWSFSHLCNLYGAEEGWLQAAKSCLSFAKIHGIDPSDGRMYFTMTEDGRPLRKRRYSSCERFYIAGNAEYSIAAKDPAALDEAKRYFAFMQRLLDNPASDPYHIPPKVIPSTRSTTSFGASMIMMDICDTMCRADEKNQQIYMDYAETCLERMLKFHYKEDLEAVLETVGTDGSFLKECSAGRVVNPGHTLESVWFILRFAKKANRPELIPIAENIYRWAFARGWDSEYGGIYYFVDVLGYPPEQYEHDMKLWWPQNEAIISALMLFQATKNRKYWADFVSLTDYAFSAFSDPEYGEWYGYLRRDNSPTLPAAKGSTFKGPFHLIRMLTQVSSVLEELGKSEEWGNLL